MSEVVHSYKELIEQAYINPIRSVVVVDDDFPTLDRLLQSIYPEDNAANSTEIAAQANLDTSSPQEDPSPDSVVTGLAEVNFRFRGQKREVERAAALIQACRERPWTVDIHDGSPNDGVDEVSLAPSLHHSDLMILDFHLNGDAGDGSRAIEILRALSTNNQFNLVVVYTKGIGGDLTEVFRQLVIGLAHRELEESIPAAKIAAIRQFLEEWQEESGEDLDASIKERVSIDFYLAERAGVNVFEKNDLEVVFKGLLNKCPENIKNRRFTYFLDKEEPLDFTERTLYEYAIFLRHAELQAQMSTRDLGKIKWQYSAESNWLRLDQLFVTVVKKDAQPAELVSRLTSALIEWAPGPHQLLMTKMRGELSEKGVAAEAEVLANLSLQAGWLHQLLSKEDPSAVMAQTISRHWEALGDGVYEEIEKYASRLFQYFRNKNSQEVLDKYLEANVEEAIRVAHLNHYYSTKTIDSSHLTTGQIIEFKAPTSEDANNVEHWICLSPACDLVPGQKKGGWKSRLGDAMPFIAVQLQAGTEKNSLRSIKDALKNVNQNRYVFMLGDDGSMMARSFTADSKGSTIPIWEQMFALNGGGFLKTAASIGTHTLLIQRMGVDTTTVVPPAPPGQLRGVDVSDLPDETILQFSKVEARVVCQLRYEYALNLLQRLGSTLSRVGLDFRGL